MFKTIGFLFKKIKEYDFLMIPIMLVYTILFAAYPFIWIIVPAKVISLSTSNEIFIGISYIILGGILAIICAMGTSFLKGNYRMRMNNIRYKLIRDLMKYSLRMPYENTVSREKLTEIELADKSVLSPMQGAGGIILSLLSLSGSLLASLGFLSLIFTLSPWIMVFLFLIVLGTFYFSFKGDSYERTTWKDQGNHERQYYRTTNIMTDFTYGKDIRLYNLMDILEDYCNKLIEQFKNISRSISKKNIQMDTLVAFLNILRDLLVFGYISRLLLIGEMDPSQFFLYTAGVSSFVVIMQGTMKEISHIKKESNRFSHFIKLVSEEEKEAKDLEKLNKLEEILRKTPVSIDIVNLSFSYPGSEKNILEDLNLHIRSGEKMALVGENGTGKSTLIKLLCKLYKPTSGNIYMNGINIHKISNDLYWKTLGVVFQDAMVFPFSIKENISLNEEINEKKLDEAIYNSGIKELVGELPKGIDTRLLRILDDEGLDISGGQRQRLFLGRALYKYSSFLILDEPTAALDPKSEEEIFENLINLTEGKTSIFVSHRLSSTRIADRIIVLDKGKIMEEGSHVELIEYKGLYSEMYKIQAKQYM